MAAGYLHKMRPGAQDFPLMVHIELTYVCNSLCPHCPYTAVNSDIRRRNWEKGNRHIDVKLFCKVADEVGRHKRFLRVTAGGEPMMHPDCVELLIYAKNAGCSIGLITNGSLISPVVSEALLDSGIDVIEFSVDAGDKKTYERVRPGLDWDQLMRNIDFINKKRDKERLKTRVIVSVISQKAVSGKIKQIEDFWKKKVDYVIVRKFLSWGIVNRGKSLDNTPFLNAQTPCPYPFERCAINQEGKVILCGYDIKGQNPMGSVKSSSIEKIWNGPGYKRLREAMWVKEYNKISFCRDCQDRIYRSWDHNYLKTLKNSQDIRNAALVRKERSA